MQPGEDRASFVGSGGEGAAKDGSEVVNGIRDMRERFPGMLSCYSVRTSVVATDEAAVGRGLKSLDVGAGGL